MAECRAAEGPGNHRPQLVNPLKTEGELWYVCLILGKPHETRSELGIFEAYLSLWATF